VGTQALIQLANPAGGQPTRFRVHYDGGTSTGDELSALIHRDGYETVHQTIADQPSRFWVSLDSSLHAIPEYVSSFPASWDVELVAGYGLLFVGTLERVSSSDPSCFNPSTWEGIVWTVSAQGKVGGGFSRTA